MKYIMMIMSSAVFTKQDLDNILSWFNEMYVKNDKILEEHEKQTISKLALYCLHEKKSLS